MEAGKELYRKYKGMRAASILGNIGPVVGYGDTSLLIAVGESQEGWTAYEGYKSLHDGVIHLPECGGTIYMRVNRVMEENII